MQNGLEKNAYTATSSENKTVMDLDQLNENPILYDLMAIFMKSSNYSLNLLILKLIFNCFNQRSSLIKELKHMQIIIEDKQV